MDHKLMKPLLLPATADSTRLLRLMVMARQRPVAFSRLLMACLRGGPALEALGLDGVPGRAGLLSAAE